MTEKEILNLRKSLSKKTGIMIHSMFAIVVVVTLLLVYGYWITANKLTLNSGITFGEITNYNIQNSYSGTHMRALEFYHKGLKDISLAFYTLCIWVLAVFLRKRNKRILEHIDNLDIKANHRIHSIAGYADSE